MPWANERRSLITQTFEASSGDVKNGVEPFFISWSKGGKDALVGEVTTDAGTMKVGYRLVDPTLTDADVPRVFHIAYLDVLTRHGWQNRAGGKYPGLKLELTNRETGTSVVAAYPDPE